MPTRLRDRLVEQLALRYRRWATRRLRVTPGAVLSAARGIMRRRRYCLLATPGEGGVDARVLQPFPPDRDLTVWLGTSRSSRKVAQLRRDPSATLAYQDDPGHACAVLVGRATVVEALAERQGRFMPFWRAFWPEGPGSDDFVLLRFEPVRIEVWDARRRVTPPPFGLRSACVTRAADGTWEKA